MNQSVHYVCPHKYETLLQNVVEEGYPFFIASIVINSVTCIPIVVINLLVIAVIFTTKSLQSPSNILICSLAITDFMTGFLMLPLYVVSRVTEVKNDKGVFCPTWIISRMLSMWLSQASLLNLTALSVDRLVAVHVGLRYRSIVTKKRVVVLAVILWLFAAFLSCIRLFSSDAVFSFLGIGATNCVICLMTMTAAYWKTSSTLRRHQIQMKKHIQTSSQDYLNVLRYKRSINTMRYVVSLVLFCYVPFISLSLVVSVSHGRTTAERIAWNLVDTIAFLNSLVNPIMYYWRIKEIRRALRSLNCLLVYPKVAVAGDSIDKESPKALATSEARSVNSN